MHKEVMDFISKVRGELPHYFKGKNVLEVGSLNLNGSPRDYFEDCIYTGIDLGLGDGVDVVCHVADLPISDNTFDVVISTEAMEHDHTWRSSLRRMDRLLVSGGLLLITCAGPEREEHGTDNHTPKDSPFTNDYYGNISMAQFKDALDNLWGYSTYELRYCRGGMDLMFWGVKR